MLFALNTNCQALQKGGLFTSTLQHLVHSKHLLDETGVTLAYGVPLGTRAEGNTWA